MKKFFFASVFIICTLCSKAQVPDHIPLMTVTWDLLDTKTYKPNVHGIYTVFFPPTLRAINKTVIELPGYIIPIRVGMMHQVFMLSVLPVLQCQFCGQAGIPQMVEVSMKKPIAYSDNPIRVKGTLVLNDTDDSRSEFMLINAVAVESK